MSDKPLDPPAAYPIAVVANAACVLDGYIYVTGGWGHRDAQGNGEFVNRAYRYSPAENQWERLPDMPIARCFHACAAAEGKVWLFGGLSRGGTEDSVIQVDCYDPDTGKWSTPTNLPTPRNRLAAVAVGHRMYVTGGMSAAGDSAAVEILDASTLKWTDGPPLPQPCHGHALAAVGETLIMAGGSGRPDDTRVFEAGNWRDGAKLSGAYMFAAAATVDSRVYLIGNRTHDDIPLLRYDLKADKWEKIADKSVQTHRAAAVNLEGRIYVICGEDPEGGELSRVLVYDPGTGAWRHSE